MPSSPGRSHSEPDPVVGDSKAMVELTDLCRVCLATVADIQTATLFATTYQTHNLCDMMTMCTSLQLHPDDGLPGLICASCLPNLITAHEFRVLCHSTDQKLRDLLNLNEPSAVFMKVERVDRALLPVDDEDDAIENIKPNEHEAQVYEDDDQASQYVDGTDDGAEEPPLDDDVEDEQYLDESTVDAVTPKPESRRTSTETQFTGEVQNVTDEKQEAGLTVQAVRAYKPRRRTPQEVVEFACTVCEMVFYKQFRLNAHMNTHAQSKTYFECDKCKVRFPNEPALMRHRVKHDADITEPLLNAEDICIQYICEICARKFSNRDRFQDHMRRHEEEDKTANEADRLVKDLLGEEIAETMVVEGADGEEQTVVKFRCLQCPREFDSQLFLSRHLRTHLVARPQFDCDQCERSFGREEQLVKHMLRHDQLKKHECPECKKVFTHIGTLRSHVRTHSTTSQFLCCECGKSFGNSGNLKTHMIRHSGDRPYECNQCFSRFSIKGDLHNHMKTHTAVRPATCDLCGASFTRQSTLNKHKMKHEGIKPYACEMCDMRFSSNDHVKRHMRIHTGEKPYKCEYCPRAFTQKNDLVKHTRSHVGDSTYKCKECPAAYRLFNDLKVHARTHQKTVKELLVGIGANDTRNKEPSSNAVGSMDHELSE